MKDFIQKEYLSILHEPIPIKKTEIILEQMKNSICLIKNNNNNGIGILCKITIGSKKLTVLMTNINSLNEDSYNNIEIIFKNKNIEIKLSKFRKRIKIKDIILIELIPNKDKIKLKYFIDLDDNTKENNSLNCLNLYMIYHSRKEGICINYGILSNEKKNDINNFIIDNTFNISFVFSLNSLKLIGICDEHSKIIIFNNSLFNNYYLNKYGSNNNLNEMTIIYNINNAVKEIKLFNSEFVDNNKVNCKLIINGKELELCNSIKIDDYNLRTQKNIIIKLKETKTISNMSNMFYGCDLLKCLPYIKWNTENVTNMKHMFSLCKSLEYLSDISNWNTSNVTNMKHMFSDCWILRCLPDISKWNIANVTNISSLFDKCEQLESLPDISKWNTANVKDMSYLFYNCKSLINLPDISKWDITNVQYLTYTFSGIKSVIPDISKWNTRNVICMRYMFSDCELLKNLPDISEWNTSKLQFRSNIFFNCCSLEKLPNISKWNISNLQEKELYLNDDQ